MNQNEKRDFYFDTLEKIKDLVDDLGWGEGEPLWI